MVSFFSVQVWLLSPDEAAPLQITTDGETWTTVATFARSDDWTLVELDAPMAVQIRMRSP